MNDEMREFAEELQSLLHKGNKLLNKMGSSMGQRGNFNQRGWDMGFRSNGNDPYNDMNERNNIFRMGYDPRFM